MTDSDAAFYTLTMARIYRDQGNWDEAEKIYRHLMETGPHHREAREALAEIRTLRRASGPARLASLMGRWMELVLLGQRLGRLKKMNPAGTATLRR